MQANSDICEGGCTCGDLRYRMVTNPLIVHGCHCTFCQRQTGTAFATNALIEADRVEILEGGVEYNILQTPSGAGQRFTRCANCRVTVWSEYLVMTGGHWDVVYFVRVGTLDSPAMCPPDIHIYTSTKQPWLKLPSDARAVEEYYETRKTWSRESLARLDLLRAKIKELDDPA